MTVANKRLANKVIWGLEDITALCRTARSQWDAMMARAEEQSDHVMLVHLARMRDTLAEIDRRARDARQGEYDG